MRHGVWAAALGGILFATSASASGASRVTAEQALQQLLDGNKRFVSESCKHPHHRATHRTELAKGQHPFAVILTCADSRVSPEVVFDQGLGDLFVVRVAGNIVDDAGLGSIEYGVEHLGAPLVVVMGHEKCGAVIAAMAGPSAPGHIGSLLKPIQPAVKKAKGKPGDALDNTVRANVELGVEALTHSKPLLEHLVHDGKVKVVGARYDLDTGEVEFLKP